MCESGCSLPVWSLVSMPLDGGNITPEYELALGPIQMIQENGVFYIADTFNFSSMSIFSINLNLNNSIELVAGLNYEDIMLDASSLWLYHSQGDLVRHELLAWDSIGQTQIIETEDLPNLKFVNTMHHDSNYLYYWLWKDGFKRLLQ